MSDVMLFGVLRMPCDMAMSTELGRRQFHGRVQEALDRLEAAEKEREKLVMALEAAEGWITMASHGDNCHLDEDHNLGKGCHCGQESVLGFISGTLEATAAAMAQESGK